MIHRRFLAVCFVLGCGRALPAPVIDAQVTPLEAARARPILPALQGRFSFDLAAEATGMQASTGGVVILDRPGRGHIAVLGPLGGPLATLQTDGAGAAVAIGRDRQHYVSPDAEVVLREATHGLVGLDDLLGLFVGDLPLDEATVRSARTLADPPLYEVVLDAPDGITLTVGIAPADATPASLVAVDERGRVMLDVRYAPFAIDPGAPGALLPTDIAVELPLVGLAVDVHLKSWTVPDPVPDVFGLTAPDGFTSSPLEESVRTWARLLMPVPGADRMGTSEEGG